jgi:ABC-2 type transport system ATP-binding protein
MAGSSLITVNRVTRRFGGRTAVNDVSFEVERGEIVGLLGPNGAGKSTTMNMICGVMSMSSGSISIAGHDIVDAPEQAKQHLGYLPEQPPLYADLTVDEYLRYCARLRGIPRSGLMEAVTAIKRRCGLDEVGRRLLGNLSRGYQQRAGIAQALIHNPVVVVLDEPTAGLDPNQIIEIRELIRELRRQSAVILSSHILPEVQGLCDRIAILHQGVLALDAAIGAIADLERTFAQLTGSGSAAGVLPAGAPA